MKEFTATLNDLIEKVQRSFSNYNRKTIQSIWIVQYNVYREILINLGNNQCRVPHAKSRKNGIQNGARVDLYFDLDMYNRAYNHIRT